MARESASTRLTLLVPGLPGSADQWNQSLKPSDLHIAGERLEGAGVEGDLWVQWVENDGHFGQAFSFGTVADDVVARIDAAPGALVLDLPVDLKRGREKVCHIVDQLRSAGALAVRVEQSKLGWEVGEWLSLMSSDDPRQWHRAVVMLLGDDDWLQSCGMHAFSLPDVRMGEACDDSSAQELATALNAYQLAEDPLLLSGQTFAPDQDTPRRVLVRWPDGEYGFEHPCHNPYGVWRLGAPGGVSSRQPELAHVFIPSLASVLAALESKSPSPLTKLQVLQARDAAACVAMEHRDVRQLEWSRGYTDLEPEWVWEQWKVLRSSRRQGGQ